MKFKFRLAPTLDGVPLISRKRANRERLRLADAARDAKRYDEAADLYAKYLIYRPENASIHVQAGHMYKEVGKFREAEQHYLKARLLIPNDADLSLQLGHFYKLTNRVYDAMGAYEHAVSLSPDWVEPLRELEGLQDKTRTTSYADDLNRNQAISAGVMQSKDGFPSRRPTISDVQQSGLFNANWYRKRYPDVARMRIDPLDHFMNDGMAEGREPGPDFDPEWYRETYPHVNESGIDPFCHYVLIGREHGYKPAGPPLYTRWVEAFDTLNDQDLIEIKRHIEGASLASPRVILVVNEDNGHFFSKVVQSLRRQCLAAEHVLVCLAPDVSELTTRTVRAVIGSDPMFGIVSTGTTTKVSSMRSELPILLLDAAVELREHALYMFMAAWSNETDLLYVDEDRLDLDGLRIDPLFKPEASPELLCHYNYIGACVLLRPHADLDSLASLIISGQKTVATVAFEVFKGARKSAVRHLPFVLFHDHLAPRPQPKPPIVSRCPNSELPTVTIVIPTRDRVELLSTCIDSLWVETDYPHEKIEVIIVDNSSEEQATARYLESGARAGKFRVLDAPMPFNYARLNNIAVQSSTAEIIVLLNNDTVIQDGNWLRRLVGYAMQSDVAAVGPKLLYEDGTIQHAGVILSIGGVAAHAHLGLNYDAPGAMGLAQQTHEVSVVTGACLVIRRSVYNEIGGLDEDLPVAFNDVLLCLECLDRGYRNIYVHDVWVRHAESKSRGVDDTHEKMDIFLREARYARSRFPALFARDPYYNPNLSLLTELMYSPAFPPRCRKPWKEFAAQTRKLPKVLLLTASLSERDSIGPVVVMQARYLAASGYDVVVGSPKIVGSLDLGGAQQAEVKRAEAAAIYAVNNDVDIIIIHTWPYMKVARLLSTFPKTVLFDHGVGGQHLISSSGERWAAHVEHTLALESFDMTLASSEKISAKIACAGTLVCAPGVDRLGRWSIAVQPLRDQTRQARGFNDRFVIAVGGLPTDLDKARDILDRLTIIARKLNSEQTIVAVIVERSWQDVEGLLLLPTLTAGELAGLYAAADVYLDMSSSDEVNIGALEAGALGARVIRTDLGDAYGDFDGTKAVLRLVDAIAEMGKFDGWNRRTAGVAWTDALVALNSAIGTAVSRPQDNRRLRATLLSNAIHISQSGLFDEGHYISYYPGDTVVASDPVGHYMVHGWREGRRPSQLFHSDWYLEQYPDVRGSGLDPLSHYLGNLSGSYDPNPFFSNGAYLAAQPEALSSGLSPFVHYLRSRASNSPTYHGPRFDPIFYQAAYPEAATAGVDPLLHFLTEGEQAGLLPAKPEISRINVYDVDSLGSVSKAFLKWQGPKATAITDVWSAARFCIELLSSRSELRTRFPTALSDGGMGDFAVWLAKSGAGEFGLSDRSIELIDSVFVEDISASIMQEYLTNPKLMAEYPFALTPNGLGKYIEYLCRSDRREARRIEQVRWFAISLTESKQAQIVKTYQFTPALQNKFPTGITLFGRDVFANWLRWVCGLEGDWLDSRTWPQPLGWNDQIRVAWSATPTWKHAHPDPFSTSASARAFVSWLASVEDLSIEAKQKLKEPGYITDTLVPPSFNMLGHFGYPSGLRTSTEALVEGYRRLGHSVAVRDVWVHENEADPRHADYNDPEIYDTTIIHVQPEPLFDVAYSRAGLAPREARTYRIGYWYWELDTVPASWSKRARKLDEIWTATKFVADAFRSEFDIPVHVVMPGLELPAFKPLPRSHFGLPENRFLFLFTFHMTSIMERKNPLSLIRAFKRAFPNNKSVGLVLKTSFGSHHPDLLASLHRAADGSNITIIDDVYTQAEVLGLMQVCDAYVSLHRSEGYGLTMAEAMLLGKPVVATNYSGNLDFMSSDTSLLVDYDLVTLDRPYGPYDKGTRWAEPSIDHAAECLRKVFSDRDWAVALGARAQADLLERMSYKRSAALIEARLTDLRAIRT